MSRLASGLEVDLEAERGVGAERFRVAASFTAGAGITVVFGPSGAGKSTLLLAVLGALAPRQGSIRLGGDVLFDAAAGIDRPVRARRIGIVFQDALLFPHLDTAANVAFGLSGTDRPARAAAMLERVGALALAARRPADLSGGERQRVALARALAVRPRALLLDEPFSALDLAAREALGELCRQIQAELAIPFLHVTHDPGEALRLGSAMVRLERGRMVAAGTPAMLLAALGAEGALSRDNLFVGTILAHAAAEGSSAVDLGGTRVEVGGLSAPVGAQVALALRPEDVLVSLAEVRGTSARNRLHGAVMELALHDGGVEATVATPVPFRVLVTRAAAKELRLAPGLAVHLLIKAHSFRPLR